MGNAAYGKQIQPVVSYCISSQSHQMCFVRIWPFSFWNFFCNHWAVVLLIAEFLYRENIFFFHLQNLEDIIGLISFTKHVEDKLLLFNLLVLIYWLISFYFPGNGKGGDYVIVEIWRTSKYESVFHSSLFFCSTFLLIKIQPDLL